MEKLNPFLKGVTSLACGLLLSFSYSVSLNVSTILICLIFIVFFSKVKILTGIKFLIPALLAAVSIFFTGLWFSNTSGSSVYNALQLSTKIMSYAALGALFSLTSDGEEFVMSLIHQGRLAPKYAYGVLAAFHLVPHIRIELKKIKQAYQVRGISVRWYSAKPVFSMLVNALHWSESVAMAMEAKGFDGEGQRTYYKKTRIHWIDWCFLGGMLLFITLGTIDSNFFHFYFL